MATHPFKSQILLDVGISMGDEGKGRLIPEVIHELVESTGLKSPVGMVLKVNGGANSGHTTGGLKLNLYPAGVIEREVPVLGIASGVVADPHKFLWEAVYIEKYGYSVRDRLLIDERTMISDLTHRLLDLAWEHYRVAVMGEEKRGSTGRGISPAYTDETAQFALCYAEFRSNRERFSRRFLHRVKRALNTIQHVCQVTAEVWDSFFQILTDAETRAHRELIEDGLLPAETFNFHRFKGSEPFTLNLELLENAYWEAGQALVGNIGDVREKCLQVLAEGRYIVGEFGQAFWLDKRFGFAPNVTASHTLPAEFFLSAFLPLQPAHVFGVCKAYDTKVGTHVFVCRFAEDHPLGRKLSQLEFGVTTGRQRMVGWFDAVEKGDSLRYGGFNDLVINKLDALSPSGEWHGGELLICTGYRGPDGKILQHVPRDIEVHRKVQPVYCQVPCWSEDISGVRTFDNLPLAAKRYVATLMRATLNVAFGKNVSQWPKKLPNLRYIGVGPNPEQIISDVPVTEELIKLAADL